MQHKPRNAHSFQINAVIRFSRYSTCFEPHEFIIKKSVRNM